MSEHKRQRRYQMPEVEETEVGIPAARQEEAPSETVQTEGNELLERMREALSHAVCWVRKVGLTLFGLLALLGRRIAVGTHAAYRMLLKYLSPPEETERNIEYAPNLSAEDSHGAAERRKRHEAQRRQICKERIRFAALVLCALVAVVSFVMIVKTVARSVRTHLTNRELAQKRAELAVSPEPTTELAVFTPEEAASPAQTDMPTPAPVDQQEEEPAAAAEISSQPAHKDVVKTTQYHVASGTPLAHMEALYEENRDLIGWLRMEKILDLPVMYRDNSYYLKRDFYKRPNEAGTLFLDENHRFSEWTQNLLLHGHNMKDGTMFGRLTQYLNLSYLKNNPFVQFDTLWREEHYVIFAVLRVSLDVKDENFFNYFSYPAFDSDAQFEAYIRRLQLKSEYAIPLDVKPEDALLTLSTCLDEDRLVIVCRRLREGETRSQARSAVRLAVKQ